MVVAVSAPDERDYGTIIVVGGGCYGSYYVRQLEKARAADRIGFHSLTVVDRDTDCAVSKLASSATLVVSDWSDFFDEYLSSAASDSSDAIVPSPLMPHLMYQWLVHRAHWRWPAREITTIPLPSEPPTPWKTAAPDGTHYASYATWVCPINCIEPRICPHTKGERTWTMPDAARAMVQQSSNGAGVMQGPVIFHCTHRAFGVGMFDTREVVAADAFVEAVAASSPADVLVGTVSHCHGAFNLLHVGAPTE